MDLMDHMDLMDKLSLDFNLFCPLRPFGPLGPLGPFNMRNGAQVNFQLRSICNSPLSINMQNS